ncbi:hypothetical protein [Treponema sp.]|uniref:hypothetical protein n=1 Tax=Treponema sp. TaxID=166 RepID=UPI00389107C1
MAKDVEITLKKEGAQDITVKCPETIKQSTIVAVFGIFWGMPTFRVKPINWKDTLKGFGLYAIIFIACIFFAVSTILGILALLGALALNFLFNKNYFYNFIKKHLNEGYSVDDDEQKQILRNAGLLN